PPGGRGSSTQGRGCACRGTEGAGGALGRWDPTRATVEFSRGGGRGPRGTSENQPAPAIGCGDLFGLKRYLTGTAFRLMYSSTAERREPPPMWWNASAYWRPCCRPSARRRARRNSLM